MAYLIKRPYILAFMSIKKDFDLSTIIPHNDPYSGWHRLKLMFQKDDTDQPRRELKMGMISALGGFFISSVIGGVTSAKQIHDYLKDSNLLVKMADNSEAKRNTQRALTRAFFKGAFHWGIKGFYYGGVFTYTYLIISLYRGKSSLLEYVVAGFLTGSLLKIKYGIRGIIIDGILGTLIATVFGCLHLLIMTLEKSRMQDILHLQYEVPVTEFIGKRHDVKKYMEMEKSIYINKLDANEEKK